MCVGKKAYAGRVCSERWCSVRHGLLGNEGTKSGALTKYNVYGGKEGFTFAK